MDEKLQRQLIRQLKILNFWITTLGILLLVGLAIIGYMLFQVITFAREASNNIQQLQQNTTERLNVRNQACDQDGAIGEYLRSQTDICKQQQ